MDMGIELYLAQLSALPFVRGARLLRGRAKAAAGDVRLELATPTGKHTLRIDERRSHLTRASAEHLVAQRPLHPGVVLFAPHVGRDVGEALAGGKVQFMDLAGNCFVQLGDAYIARIQGKAAAEVDARDRALRAPSYRVLFALLTQPELLNAPARELATASGGVSPQTVLDVRERFVASKAFMRVGPRRFRWAAHGRRALCDLWLAGARTTLYPQLIVGRYRAREHDLAKFEAAAADRLRDTRWAWGGAAAAHRLTGFYRGTSTVIYVDAAASAADLAQKLELVPDAQGPVALMHAPGPSAFDGPEGTAHPLLVYTDLLQEGEPRAHEAASVYAEKYLPEDFVR